MRLADRIAQCRTPFIVENTKDGSITHLNNAAAFSKDIDSCATRYVLSDELARLCTALAYSKGARTLACADLVHVPAERVWVEWAEAPWRDELARYGFKNPVASPGCGRRGVFIQSTPQGRRGLLRTFWADGESELHVLSSSMEAYFDFDAAEGENPQALDRQQRSAFCVSDNVVGAADILRRCFRFRFERTWQDYYEKAQLTRIQATALSHHALGTIAIDIPVLLAFFFCPFDSSGPAASTSMLERLNKARARSGKVALLEQVEVFARCCLSTDLSAATVQSHLDERAGFTTCEAISCGALTRLFWRVPHLRGHARAGSIRTRTVTWQFDPSFSSRIDQFNHIV